jgi:hypothetical protein
MARSFIGRYDLPLGLRNNNPGNIRPGENWQGAISVNQNFIVFENVLWGIRALGTDIRTKINNGYNTIQKLITRYAPPFENNTTAYINAVSNYTGISPTATLQANQSTLKLLMRAIMNVELGVSFSAIITDQELLQGIEMMSGTVPGGVIIGGGILSLLILAGAGWLVYDNVFKPRPFHRS